MSANANASEIIKRKRGRPRNDSPVAAAAPTATATPTVDEAPAKPRRVARQRARQAPIPTMTIQSYGRREIITDEQENESEGEPSSVIAATDSLPIILSLPISDVLEQRLSASKQETLDVRLTSYRPDVISVVPSAVVASRSIGGAAFESTSKPLVMERCVVCVTSPGPCKSCISSFNQQFGNPKDVLSAYQQARSLDDVHALPDRSMFHNVQIEDAPVDSATLTSAVYTDAVYGVSVGEGVPGVVETPGDDQVDSDVSVAILGENHLVRTSSMKQQSREGDLRVPKSVRFDEPKVLSKPDVIDTYIGECMWHLAPFDTAPVGLPLSFNENTQTFECIGRFCSLECAYAYRLEHRSAEAAPIRLLHLAHSMLGKSSKPLAPAPPRQALKRFGGTMSLEAFLASSGVWYSINRPPFVFMSETVEALEDGGGMYRSMSGATSAALTTPASTTELVRKRDKPHPNSMNQWHSSIQRSRAKNPARKN